MEGEGDLHKIRTFLTRGKGTTHHTKRQAHLLYGWRWNTVLLYNGAVKKFLKFIREETKRDFGLPESTEEIYNFCLWAGRTQSGPTNEDVLSITVSKYLHGKKAWHLYHFEDYPVVNEGVIRQMLTA